MKLTQKDIELLQKVMGGYTYREVANIMHVSPRTIEWRIQRIKQKIGAKNKIEVINYFNAQIAEDQKKSLPDNGFNLFKRLVFKILHTIHNAF